MDSSPRRRLVVCDDDEMARQIVGMLAEGAGYEVVGEATTAIEDALQRARTSSRGLQS